MPELPEVETIRRDLEAEVVGRTVGAVELSGRRTFRRYPAAPAMEGRLTGARLDAADRYGKYLVLRFGAEDVVVHLGMSGQLLYADRGSPRPAHTHAVWSFVEGPELRFVDPRTFGEVFLAAGGAPGGAPVELAHLGADPLDPAVDRAALAARLATRRTRLKPLLLDQRFLAGIGNMYADEILWGARLDPERPASAVNARGAERLHATLREVLTAAIAARGSSLADEQYRDLYGRVGGYQLFHRAYGREGLPCARCGRPIRRRRANGRSTFSCSSCQR